MLRDEPNNKMTTTFKQLGVPDDLNQGIEALGILEPTPIQKQAIPLLMEDGGDLIAQAQTGTGKTAAFGLPLLTKIDPTFKEIQGLIIAPTRELAQQIAKQLFRYTKFATRIFVEVVSGGDKIDLQIKKLQRPTHIVVATPGRLIDLLKLKAIRLQSVRHLVLDEADEMLSMGFQSELETILKETAARKSTWLFSATFQAQIKSMVEQHMSANAQILKLNQKHVVNQNIDHQFAICSREDKTNFIYKYLKSRGDERGLIFCRTRAGAISLGQRLTELGLAVGVLQGDLSQKDREKVMRSFKKKRTQFLLATDVAARGIDVEGLSFVIQHQLPDAMQYYTHRSGRTARAGRKGVSITLIEPTERRKITQLEKELGLNFSMVESFFC